MCFHINKEKCPKALIAKKDIRVYKKMRWLNKKLVTSAQLCSYKPNKIYKSTFTYSGFGNRYIERGRHSFSTFKKALRYSTYSTIICEFIIPKGSEYYFNLFHEEYVSNQIK